MDHRMLNRLFGGLILVGIGVLFLLKQLDLITFSVFDVLRTFWPVFLIYFGLKGILIQQRNDSGWTNSLWSGFVALLGIYFLLRNLNVGWIYEIDLWQFLVPVILIIYGLSLIGKGNGDNRKRSPKQDDPFAAYDPVYHAPPKPDPHLDPVQGHYGEPAYAPPQPDPYQEPYGYSPPPEDPPKRRKVTRASFIGDIHLGQDYWELEPMDISHFIGDTIIDLTKAYIPYGETKLNISAFIGDVKIFVPNDIQVEFCIHSSVFIGDMKVNDRHEGGIFRNMEYHSPYYADAEKKIHLNVSMFIGDVLVKRVG